MIEIKSYTPDCYDDVCRLNVSWISDHWQLEPRDYDEMEQMRDGIENGFMLVAVCRGNVVGTIAFLPVGNGKYDYELAKFTVDKTMRGKGIGRQLIEAALKKAADESRHRIYIITNKLCHSAIHLYEEYGFKHIPGQSSLYQRGDYLMDNV